MDEVTSLKHLAVVRLAVDLCLRPDVFHAMMKPSSGYPCYPQQVWINVYNKLLEPTVLRINIPSCLQQELLSRTKPIVLRVINLVIYHEKKFYLTRAEISRSLNTSIFTSQGLVDHLKLGKGLVEDNELEKIIKYRLSCFYFIESIAVCSKPYIGNLFSFRFWQVLPKEIRELLCNEEPEDLLRIISQRLHCVDKHSIFSQRMLVKIFNAAVKSGSILAVKYRWGKLNSKYKSELLVRCSLLVVSLMDDNDQTCFESAFSLGDFLNLNYFYVDILHFLISQMNGNEKKDFLLKDVAKNYHPKSLEFLLLCPYQKTFIEVHETVKEVLPGMDFPHLLVEIVHQIEPINLYSNDTMLGNTGVADYRIILREFWLHVGDHFKRYFFSLENLQEEVLTRLISLANFTYLDEENFVMILEDATTVEKQKLFNKSGLRICQAAIWRGRFHVASWFLKTCSANIDSLIEFTKLLFSACTPLRTFDPQTNSSFDQQMKFAKYLLKEYIKKEQEISTFIMSPQFLPHQSVVCNLISYNWCFFETFVKWCFDTDEKHLIFKNKFLIDFSRVCHVLILNSLWLNVELFLTWIFSTEIEIEAYKRFVLFPLFGAQTVAYFIEGTKFQEAEKFVRWLGLSDTEIRALKHESILNHDNVVLSLLDLLFSRPIILAYSSEEGEDDLEDENSLDGDNSETEDDYESEINESNKALEICGGNVEAVELIIRWLLTDERVTLIFQEHFHKECGYYLKEDDVQVPAGLALFDQIIQQHLQDL